MRGARTQRRPRRSRRAGAAPGEPIAFSAAGSSDDEAISRYEWDLDGDGSYETDTGGSATASRTFEAAGARTARVRVTDSDGIARTAETAFSVAPGAGGAGGDGPGGGGATAARVSALSLSPSRFKVPKKKTARATTIRYSIDRSSAMTLTVEQAKTGRRSGSKCVGETKRNRKARRCTRYVALRGNLTDAGDAGANTLTWNGRLGSKALKAGTYRLVATPAGGEPRRASFKVKR